VSSYRRRIELGSVGFDEFLQLVGSDPFGGLSSVGLRVPDLPTSTVDAEHLRYLFLLSSVTISEGHTMRLRGIRQLVTIGVDLANGPVGSHYAEEFLVTSPFWRFSDGNISWHIMRMGLGEVPDSPIPPAFPAARSLAFRMSDAPALLAETATLATAGVYTTLTAYAPPNLGQPYGSALAPSTGTFYDQNTIWRASEAWHSRDVIVQGPCQLGFFASMRQTNPVTRAKPFPAINPATVLATGLSPEESFLVNFPQAKYWRIGGSLILEDVD
jgi:hypothetical protein